MGTRHVVVGAAIGAAGLLLGGCGWGNLAQDEFSDDRTIEETITSVRFDNDAGNVRIRTGDQASVHREVHYSDDKPGDTFRVEKDALVLESCQQRNCWVDYEIVVPADTTVNGHLDSGSVELTGVAGANIESESGDVSVRDVAGAVNVKAESGSIELVDIGSKVVAGAESGDVTVQNVRGGVTLKASSGDVSARGIDGAATVESDSGSVTVELSSPQDVSAHADSGNVDVTVPKAAYQVTTSTDSGDVDNAVTADSTGHRIDLETESGNITVQQS